MITNNLWSMDAQNLTPELVQPLIRIIPTEEEANVCRKIDNLDKSKLSIPDIFFMELIKIPAYDARLNALKA